MSDVSYYIDEFQDYLEEKCELNKLVAHNKVTDAAANGQRTFARFESEEHIRAIQNCAGKNIVVVADVYAQRIGEADDKELRYTIQVRFAVKKDSNTGNETDAINDAVKKAEKIMFQFQNQLEKDYEAGCHPIDQLQPERMSWDKIEEQPWLDDYYGWDLNIVFGSFMPEHDDADWDDSESSVVINDESIAIRTFKLFARFEVGEPGALLNEDDTTIIHNMLSSKNVLVIVDGSPIPVDDYSGDVDWTGSIDRHVKKLKSSNELFFAGSVENGEIVEIYTYT